MIKNGTILKANDNPGEVVMAIDVKENDEKEQNENIECIVLFTTNQNMRRGMIVNVQEKYFSIMDEKTTITLCN